MLIAQISDPHVTDDPFFIPVDPQERLAHVVAHINASSVPIDLVVATGDLTNDGTAAQYDILDVWLRKLAPRVAVLPGNHDDSALMRTALADFVIGTPADTHLSYVIDDYDLRMVCLDTSEVGRHDGVFDNERSAWLDTSLAASDEPTIVFMHHPAFECGVRWMDLMSLENRGHFADVIGRHPQVLTVASGHLHRSLTTRIAHAVANGAPSTAHQLNLDLHPDRASLSTEPSGYLLHWWNGTTIVSHAVTVNDHEVVRMDEVVAEIDHASNQPGGMPSLGSQAAGN